MEHRARKRGKNTHAGERPHKMVSRVICWTLRHAMRAHVVYLCYVHVCMDMYVYIRIEACICFCYIAIESLYKHSIVHTFVTNVSFFFSFFVYLIREFFCVHINLNIRIYNFRLEILISLFRIINV